MKVSKINKFFRRIGEAQIKHSKLCLIILFAVTLICLSGMRNFRSESSNSDWIVNGSEIKKNSDHFKEVFGNDQYVLVLVQADDVFAPDVLNMIDRLGERLESEVPFADKVTSLTTVSIPIGDEEGFEVKSPFNDGIPTDAHELAEKKAFIMSRESIVNNLVSDNAKECWISLKLNPFKNESEDVSAVGHAAEIIEDGRIDGFIKEKYSSFESGIGKKIRDKQTTLEELTALVLYGIAYHKTDEIKRLPQPNKNDIERIEILREKIQRTPALEYDAQTVADELGMSISKLNRVFRTMYATSLHSYVQDKRLEYAARLLQENDLPISQAAQLSGYTNMSHFSKSFVKKFGVLPKYY